MPIPSFAPPPKGVQDAIIEGAMRDVLAVIERTAKGLAVQAVRARDVADRTGLPPPPIDMVLNEEDSRIIQEMAFSLAGSRAISLMKARKRRE